MRPLTLHALTGPDTAPARQALALYEQSFSVAERDPVESLVDLMRRQAREPVRDKTIFRFWVGLQGEQVVGLSIYTYHGRRRLGYLWYLTTDPARRSRGVGFWLLARVLAGLDADARQIGAAPPLGMSWEVTRPQDSDDPAERLRRERRIRFYQRNGALLLDKIEFVAPPLGEGLPAVPFHLMYAARNKTAERVSAALARRIVDLILLDGYEVDPSHPYYRQAVKSILDDDE